MKTNSKGNTAIAPEKIVIGTKYSITINPKDQPVEFTDKFIMCWYRKIYDTYIEYRDDINMDLYMESSQTARLHFHGTIVIYNILPYLKFVRYLNEYTHFEIDTIGQCECPEGKLGEHTPECRGFYYWMKYIKKGGDIWRPLLTQSTIGYPLQINSAKKPVQPKFKPMTFNYPKSVLKVLKKSIPQTPLQRLVIDETDEDIAREVALNRIDDD